MSRPPSRWKGQAPSRSLLLPVWQPLPARALPSDDQLIARSLLGAGWVGASRRLSTLDLRVWAALCALLRSQLPEPPADDPTLDRASIRTVHTTAYQLADMVFADDGGNQLRQLYRSLARLRAATVTVEHIDADPEIAAARVARGMVGLLGDVWIATAELNLTTPAQWRALRGTASLDAEIGRWSARVVVEGRATWLDLDLLRQLGSGLAARLWPALEAWASWPAASMDGREECAIGLGEPARQSLGVGGYQRAVEMRRALNRAGARIVATDPAYELIRCERRAGWCLVIRRFSGARARARARSDAPWRSPGIAASKRQRPERAAVRAAAAKSLATAQRKPV